MTNVKVQISNAKKSKTEKRITVYGHGQRATGTEYHGHVPDY